MRNAIIKCLAAVTIAVLTIYLFPHHTHAFHYHAEVGRPWQYQTLTADFDFPIYKTDRQLEEERSEVLRDFAPCFSWIERPSDRYIISLQDYERLQDEGNNRISIINKHVRTIRPISEVYTPRMAYEAFHEECMPTLCYDTATTRMLRSDLLQTIALTSGMIQEGEKIIEQGEIVDPYDYQVLQSLRRAYEEKSELSHHQRWLNISGDAILVCLFILFFSLYLLVFRPNLLAETQNVLFFCLIAILVIAMACLLMRYTTFSIYLIPFAWVPILTRVFYDSRTALFIHLTTIFIASIAAPAPFEFLVIQTAVGMVAVASMKDLTRRAQLIQTAGLLILTYAVVYTGFVLATTGDLHAIDAYNYLYFLINGILIVCSYGLIYIFERVFHLLSSVTLVELTDINSDLLHDFAEQAPGSFQHSMQVSNLATEAAKQIGANSLLVRTGALYHDIGKMSNPQYFTENQQDDTNPISALSSRDAAQLIISHVTEGEVLARKHHLPEVIIHFILTHHGDSLVRYFYNTAVNNGENPDPADYRYPGSKPNTRETAILMMADAVEARSRSLRELTEESISAMVNDMIDQQIADGQFSEAPITFKDVTEIKRVFIHRLTTINHHRIKYPTIKGGNV